MPNPGKLFEQDFQNSAPDHLYVYRLRDCPAWDPGGGTSRRFTPSNDYDFFVYDPTDERAAYALELKSVKGKSIRFDSLRDNQIEGLTRASRYMDAGVLIEFREVGEAWYMPIRSWTFLMTEDGAKKSINVEEMRRSSWTTQMPGKKKITRWTWDVEDLLTWMT